MYSEEFITEAIPCKLVGMNATMMTEYIKFVANRLLLQFGYNPIYAGGSLPANLALRKTTLPTISEACDFSAYWMLDNGNPNFGLPIVLIL